MSAVRTVGARIAEDLRGAAGILNRDGWQQAGCIHDDAGCHDLTGAIYVATGYHRKDKTGVWRAHALKDSAGRRSNDCIRWLLPTLPTRTVWEFNDQHCETQTEAVDALLRAADAAERSLRTPRDVERLLP